MSEKRTVQVICFDKSPHSIQVVPLHVTVAIKCELFEAALQGLFF